MIGDVVGSCGRRAFREQIGWLRDRYAPDFLLVNGENAAAGKGITRAIAREWFECGVQAITLGNHAWDQKELIQWIDEEPRVIRPANFAPGTPGQGMVIIKNGTQSLAVINLIGRTFMPPADCPFRVLEQLIATVPAAVPIVVDFHAEATSEKAAMGWFADGRVAAVFGTHTHVQTHDERILPKGTAFVTDVGMTGAQESILGMECAPIVHKFLTGLPARFVAAEGPYVLNGLFLDIERQPVRTNRIELIRVQEGQFQMH